jgi:predicted GNAT family acetyltransferase
MKKTVVTFGLMGAGLMALMMFATIPFAEQIGFDKGIIIGYTTMVLAFMFVFFGIRSYRENVGNGQIGFGRAFAVGLLIMLIICASYVIAWEIMYYTLMPDFIDRYATYVGEKARAAGATQQAVEAQIQEMKSYKPLLDNPFTNAAITLTEPLPVGLVMTLISAALLRKKNKKGDQPEAEMGSASGTFA